MKILFIGDVVGQNGINILRRTLPRLKAQLKPDITIVNGENANESGKGLNKNDSMDVFACGRDVITGGNHSLDRSDMDFYLENEYIICPANFGKGEISRGVSVVDLGRESVGVISLMGLAFIAGENKSPFTVLDEILAQMDCKNIVVDFHAESTAEKQALARYADGRVSAVLGTHTHVQTNDERILPGGTAYISDAGAVCRDESILGVETELAIRRQMYTEPVKLKVRSGDGFVNGVFIETDKNGRAVSIEKIHTKFK